MKSKKLIFGRSLLTMVTAMLVFSGCVKERMDIDPTWQSDEVLFSIQVPGSSTPTTRAIGENLGDDNMVKEVDIMLFDEADKYVRSVYCENINNTAQMHIKIAKGRLPKGTYKIVVLANVHDKVLANPITIGTPRANAFDNIKFALTNGDKWNSLPGSTSYRPFPMWGEAVAMTIIPRPNAGDVVEVTLARMLSKINVVINYTQTLGVNDFELKSVEVFNYNSQGRLVPDLTKWATTPKMATEVKTREEGATPTSLKFDNTGGHNYIVDNTTNKTFSCTDEIFVFESAANTGAWSWEKNTCVVIGGEYKGIMGYYRLDFLASDKNIDLVRNHKYNFEVDVIKNQGYKDAYEALKNVPENMKYTVTPWDDGKVSDVIVDGNVQLTITPGSTVAFNKSAEIKGVDIYTDWSEGWQVQKLPSDPSKDRIEDAQGNFIDWITVDNGGTNAAGEKKLNITVVENGSGVERKGYIHITTKGDRIQHKLTVIQSNMVPMSLQILRETSPGVFDEEMSMIQFVQDNAATAPAAQKYKIKWSPFAAPVAISLGILGVDYDLITWSGDAPNKEGTITDQFGEKTFTVQPKAFATYTKGSFKECQSLMTVRMNISGETILKTVVFQQMVKDMAIDYNGAYIMDGFEKKHFVTVRSNVNWELGVTKNISSGLGTPNVAVVEGLVIGDKLVTDGHYNLPQGNQVFFTPVEDLVVPKIYTGHLGLDLVDKTTTLATINSELFCASGVPQPLSNSYLVKTEDTPILIPVKRANGYGIKSGKEFRQAGWPAALGDQITGEYTVDLVWTDKPHNDDPLMIQSIGDDGAVKMVVKAGSNADGYILVMPGKGEGNAVVSAKVGTKIVWSWHIWVVNNPTEITAGVWMDRNLGATTKTTSTASNPTITSTLGLYYQWGRKDPMPGAGSVSTNTEGKYYLGDGSPKTAVPTWLSGSGDLLASVQDPLQSWSSWIGSKPNLDGTGTNDSWITGYKNVYDTGDKTIYDPCPDGWRVPVLINKSNTASTHHWGNEGTTSIGNKWTTYGINWPAKGGYYPAAGNRGSGGLNGVGSGGYYWSASPYSTYGYILHFYSGGVNPSNNGTRYYGFSVRCVR